LTHVDRVRISVIPVVLDEPRGDLAICDGQFRVVRNTGLDRHIEKRLQQSEFVGRSKLALVENPLQQTQKDKLVLSGRPGTALPVSMQSPLDANVAYLISHC
jgi:hypothetical protein